MNEKLRRGTKPTLVITIGKTQHIITTQTEHIGWTKETQRNRRRTNKAKPKQRTNGRDIKTTKTHRMRTTNKNKTHVHHMIILGGWGTEKGSQ